MTDLENKLDSKALQEASFFARVRQQSGATTGKLSPEEIAASLALFELLETWERGKKDSHGNEN